MCRKSSIINHRSSMRSGYTLIEMLAVIAVGPLLMVLFSRFMLSFLYDIPRSARMMDQNVTVLNLLDQLQSDMDRAVALPSQAGDRRADDATLLIEQKDAVVCYRQEEGQIVRTTLDSQGGIESDGDRIWKIPDAAVVWKLWAKEKKAYAVEVQSHVTQRVAGEIRRRFRNSHVFFVGALASGGEMQ